MATLQELKSKYKANNYRTSTSLDSMINEEPVVVKPTVTENAKSSFSTGLSNAKNAITDTSRNPIERTLGAGAEVVKGGFNAVGDTIKPVLSQGASNANKMFTGNPIYDLSKKAVGMGVDNTKNALNAVSSSDSFAQVGQKLNEIVDKYPEASKLVEDTLSILSSSGIIADAVLGTRALYKGAISTTRALPSTVSEIKGAASNVKNSVINTTEPLFGKLKIRTPEEIYATPESQVGKLSPIEREAYWKNKKDAALAAPEAELEKLGQTRESVIEEIKARSEAAQSKIDADFKIKSDASIKETQALKTEIDKTSVAEANSLKKPAIEVYKKNSKQFEKLFDEDFTPEKQSIPLKQNDLIAKLDSEFEFEPGLNPKSRLGLEVDGADITAKEFYDRVRKLTVSSAGSKGTSVFTQGDLVVNRTRGILNDTLVENGIDLSRANKFWSEWKPLQREITSKVKPFDPGYKSGTMANILKSAASEVGDAKNAKFIADFEAQLGQKIPIGTRRAMEKLSTAQKQAIADKVAVEEAKEALAAKTKAMIENEKKIADDLKKGIQNKKASIEDDIYNRKLIGEQDAATRARNKKILIYALGALGLGTGAVNVSF